MSFPDAVRSVLTQYVNFQGRSRRSEYWWYTLAYAIVYGILYSIDMAVFGAGKSILSGLFGLAVLLPSLGVSVRRLHDTGRSGWWVLLGLLAWLVIPAIVLIVFLVQDSKPGSNKYGPSPKEAAVTV